MNTTLAPFQLIVFGAFGNLAAKSIYPALYELALQRRLPKDFHIIGFGRTNKTSHELQEYVEQSIRNNHTDINESILQNVLEQTEYMEGQYDNPESFRLLESTLLSYDKTASTTWLTYFAVPPAVYQDIIKNIGEEFQYKQAVSLLFEKPFGTDTGSAEDLYHFTNSYFEEGQILIIDHYLAKYSVQNILSLREANPLLNLALRGEHISHIEITAHETVGVEDRHGYFDQMGTLKDMVQSHIFQVLALLTMDIPTEMSARSIHREKTAMLEAMRVHDSSEIIYGQYEEYAKKENTTETYVALTITFDKADWNGVPVYIRTGKKLASKQTYITVTLRNLHNDRSDIPANRIVFELQPNAKLHLLLANKNTETRLSQQILSEVISESKLMCIGDDCLPEHAKLLIYALEGRHEYFADIDEVLAGWRILDIAEGVKSTVCPIHTYKEGSLGPDIAQRMAANHTWFNLPT